MPESDSGHDLRQGLALTSLSGAFLLAALVLPYSWLSFIAIVFGAWLPVKSAWESLSERQLDVSTLMLLAAFGSAALGLPFEGAILLFLFSLSETLESFALGRTKSAIEGLIKLRPSEVLLVDELGEHKTPVKEVLVGQRVKVLPYENVPLDGRIIIGQTSANEAAMTGEAKPVSRKVGDLMLSGTQNLEGSVVIEVTASQGETTLDQVVSLVSEAQENQASGEKISAWFGSRYTIFVILVFIASLALRLTFGQELGRALYASLSVFVALSPCALVIASPSAVLSALAWAAKRGILVRGGDPIEKAGKARIVVLDKTGTLTRGKFVLSRILAFGSNGAELIASQDGGNAVDLLAAAASLESHSTHPLADAIVSAAKEKGLVWPETEDVTVKPGLGLTGRATGQEILVGQEALIPGLTSDFLAEVEAMRAEGLSTVVMKWGSRLAIFGLKDEVRPEAARVIKALSGLGIRKSVMLTGDSLQSAAAAAEAVGIKEIHARQMPADKEARIAQLEAEGGVIFVGDGINDAPSLARASVGVAMGGLGSDIAMNAADAVLMKDSIKDVPRLVYLGQQTNKVIMQSLVFAAGVVVLLFAGTLLADLLLNEEARKAILPFAVLGHEGSTVLVILNGLRLLACKDPLAPEG